MTSTNLACWTALSTNTTLDRLVSFVDTTATAHACRFYRIRVHNPEND